MMQQVNIKQLAKISGFSISTVSKALNNCNEISDLTKSKIKDLAVHYNYVPNTDAIALRKKRTNTVAVFFPENQMGKYVPILQKIENEVRSKGFRLIVSQFGNKKSKCPPDTMITGIDSLVFFREGTEAEAPKSRFLYCNKNTPAIEYSFAPQNFENSENQENMGKLIGKNLVKMASLKQRN